MRVFNRKYPSITCMDGTKRYQFKDGVCELPDGLALKVTSLSPDYELDRSSIPQVSYLPFNSNTWRKEYKKIIWDGPIGYNNGYGNGSTRFMEGLGAVGIDTYVIASQWLGTNKGFMGENLERLVAKTTDDIDSYYVKFFPAWEFTRRVAERHIGYTMLEASLIPQSWVNNCNTFCERVVVPCMHQKEAFINSGVTRDIAVIPLGIKSEEYPIMERKSDGLYYFGMHGTLTYRKGTDLLVKAFIHGLPKEQYPDARLYIKTLPVGGIGVQWFATGDEIRQDGRIEMCYESFSPQQLMDDFFAKIDCYVFPTRGEGWGYPPLEALATGLPVICTKYSGCADFMTEKTGYPIGYKDILVPNGPGSFGGYPPELAVEGQTWADPDYDQLVERMRYCYNNREKAAQHGRDGAEIVKKKFDYKVCAQKLVDYLDKKY